MKKQKNIDEIINEMTKKYHYKDYGDLVANWFYQDGVAFWTDAKIAIKVSGYEVDGLSDKLYINNPSVRQKTDDDRSCPAYDRVFPTDISDYREIKIQEIDEDLPIKDKYLQFGDGWMVYSSEEGKNPMYIKTDNDNEIKAKIHCWYYRLILELEKKCYNGKLYYLSESRPLYYTAEYADKKIEIVFAPCSMFDFHYPKWDKDKQEIKDEEEMQEEVESERERNEEPAESLNDRHEEEQEEEKEEEKDTQEQEELTDVEELEDEKYDCNDEKVSEIDKDEPLEEEKEENNIDNISEVKQELTDDMTIYDIVFEYLIKNSCIPTSNGSGGLNIDCPYQKKDIVKSLGAMWSPRYYRWYLRADRLEKAANIIKKLA